jgi:hypothetical protein
VRRQQIPHLWEALTNVLSWRELLSPSESCKNLLDALGM